MHVNWGWHGQENGYFDIALLNPGLYTYDEWQAMYVGLYPDKKETTVVGDVNNDNSVNAADVTAIYSFILNGDTTFLDTSDVNGDNSVNAADVTSVYSIILGGM